MSLNTFAFEKRRSHLVLCSTNEHPAPGRNDLAINFIQSSWNADLTLHLEAGDALSKLFFALDRIKYKRLWPRYIANMHELKTKHPTTWRELEEGNDQSPRVGLRVFVSIGA